MKLISLALLISQLSFCLAFTPFSGVAHDLSIADVYSAFSICYTDDYRTDSAITLDALKAGCSGQQIMLACYQQGSSTYHLAAYSNRADIFKESYGDPAQFVTSNGVTWYYTNGASMGFAPAGASIRQSSCDWYDIGAEEDTRLCFHAHNSYLTAGFRCGSNVFLQGVSGWRRVFLQGSVPFPEPPCATDADCSNYGVCLSSFGGNACSCLSGYGGSSKCASRPTATCTYNQVFPNVTRFNPSVATSVGDSTFSIAISAPLEQTKYANPQSDDTLTTDTSYALETTVKFGNSGTACDYPSAASWTRLSTDDSCQDKWSLTVPWATAVGSCGFSDLDGDHTWTQTVTVSRKYQLPSFSDGNPITRTESITKQLRVVFPTSVTVQTDVNVTGPVAVSVSAVVSSSYDANANQWRVVLKTVTNRPYKLTSPSVASVTGEIYTDSRYQNSAGSISITDVSACNNNNNACSQTVTLYFRQCTALVGGVVIDAIPVCGGQEGATCPHIDGTVSIGMYLNNPDSCAVVNNIDFSVKTLSSYADSAVTLPQTQFRASDIAYFGAVVQSTNATLTSFQLRGVCISWNGGGCQAVMATSLPATGGMNTVFAVNLAQTRYFTTDTSLQTFVVKATIDVTWANGKRDTQIARANLQSAFGVDLAADEDVESDVYTAGASQMEGYLVFAIILLFALL